jgi:hypothetical protein
VLTTTPMDREDDLPRLVVHMNDNVSNQYSQHGIPRGAKHADPADICL